jgi:ABC-type transport system substrate-binding protein/class 3 adenylate cyclase
MAVVAGERRIVTVLFADIVGSTSIAERLGAERSKFLVDEVMRVMGGQIERYDGTVAQYVGDELYAVFGAPLAHEDDSERAVRAALAIQRALAQYAEEVKAAYGVDLAVRIAINTGPVVIHPDSEDPYNALGDTVNVASRIQELADGGEVVVGRTTKLQIESCFELEELGEQELKGRAAPIETFKVVGMLEHASEDAFLPLVGRDFELTVLERTMDGLVDGRGAIVSITGEPGIGKSRLLGEVRKLYRDRVRFVEGRAVSYAQTFPYWPVRDLLREWLGVGASTPEARVRLDLKAELAHVLGAEADAAYPFVANLIGLALEPDAAERIDELNRESLQHETYDVFSDFVWHLAEETPLALVLEDLHWADESTLELLEALLQVTEEASVALFFLYRTERDHGSWRLGERARQRFPHRYREIELRPLPGDASRALAESVADGELPDYVAELLTERAGGNPFFLEAALHDLHESGALVRDNGRWVLAVSEDELAIPALVQGALQARIDRLDPHARNVLSVSAVIGRTFGMPLLEEIVPYEELIGALSELQRLDLIVEQRRRPNPEYRFRHGLVQEVAYSGLVEGKRRKLHLKVGEALEALYREAPEEAFALLARHFSEADEPEKAVEYLLKAGDKARAIYADQEALEHYARARDFLVRMGDERRARDTLFRMALTHHVAFDFERAEELYDEAFCCRVPPSARLERTERLTTGMATRGDDLMPGASYTTESAALLEHLFRGLVTVDRELNVVPAMADNFRVSADGLTYLFRLRDDMLWSDGVPVTAEDFAYAVSRIHESEELVYFLMEDVEEAKALDELTLEIRLSEPRGYFPYILASAWLHPLPRHKVEELGDDWQKPENLVGNGPFCLAESSSDHAVLVANPYWRGPHGNVNEVHLALGLANEELLDGWRGGLFDVVQAFQSEFASAPDTLVETVPEFGTHYVGFRASAPPFTNELVRKAFAHALDRSTVLPPWSLARPAGRGGAIPPAMPGHSSRVAPEHNPELARELLAQAGYPDGKGLPEIELWVPSWMTHTEPILDDWAALGARIRVSRASQGAVCDAPPSAQMWIAGWTVDYPDPDGFFRGFLRQSSFDLYRDEELDELLAEAGAARDHGERMRLYHEVDRLYVAERAAILPISYGRTMLVRRPWVENLWANPMSGAHFDHVVVSKRG